MEWPAENSAGGASALKTSGNSSISAVDQVGGVFGAVGIRRKDNRQRLADIANMIFGKDRLPVRLKAFNPRQAEIDRRDIGDIGRRP